MLTIAWKLFHANSLHFSRSLPSMFSSNPDIKDPRSTICAVFCHGRKVRSIEVTITVERKALSLQIFLMIAVRTLSSDHYDRAVCTIRKIVSSPFDPPFATSTSPADGTYETFNHARSSGT